MMIIIINNRDKNKKTTTATNRHISELNFNPQFLGNNFIPCHLLSFFFFYNISHSLIIFCSAGNRRQRNHDKHEHDSEGRGGSGGAGGSDVIKPVKKKAKTSRK